MRDRVSANAKGDRDRRGRSFGRKRRRIANRSDNGDATADEVGHERRQAVVLAGKPVVLDRHVLALDVARFAKALTKRGCMACRTIARSAAEKANHRSRRLLRARRERPGSRAAEQRYELAPFHYSITSSARATAKRCHSPGTPLRACMPRSSNAMPEPTTRSFTVLETSTSPGFAVAATRLPICTAIP